MLALKREVQLLRDENAYLRRQLSGQVSNAATGNLAALRTSQAGSALAVPAPTQAQNPDTMSIKQASADAGRLRLSASPTLSLHLARICSCALRSASTCQHK